MLSVDILSNTYIAEEVDISNFIVPNHNNKISKNIKQTKTKEEDTKLNTELLLSLWVLIELEYG